MPSVLVVVLAYGDCGLTLACLQSLGRLAYPNADLLVVDNGPRGEAAAMVRDQFPSVALIETGANLGYAGGNNVGLRCALEHGYDYTLLLNNDTEVAADLVEEMVAVCERSPRFGVAGPTIYYFDQPDTIWSAGGVIDRRRGRGLMRGIDELDRGQFAQPGAVDFVAGCAMLCRRSTLEQAGLLDERFFLYFEDAEWCARVRRAGFQVVHVPRAQVFHKIPADGRAQAPSVTYYMTRNRLLFLRASGAPLPVWLHAVLLQDLRTCLSWTLRPKWRGRRGQRDALLRGWWDFAHQRYGQRSQA